MFWSFARKYVGLSVWFFAVVFLIAELILDFGPYFGMDGGGLIWAPGLLLIPAVILFFLGKPLIYGRRSGLFILPLVAIGYGFISGSLLYTVITDSILEFNYTFMASIWSIFICILIVVFAISSIFSIILLVTPQGREQFEVNESNKN